MQHGHEVRFGVCRLGAHPREGAGDRVVVALPAHLVEAAALFLLDLGPDAQDRRRRLVVAFEERVHADDDVAAGVQLAFERVRRVGDLALVPAFLATGDRSVEQRTVAHALDDREDLLGLALELVGERFDIPRTAERVGDVRDARLVRDHLLGAQRDPRRLLRSAARASRPSSWCAGSASRRARRPAPRSRSARCSPRAVAR